MEKSQLFKIVFAVPQKIGSAAVIDGGNRLAFYDASGRIKVLELKDYHEQDCCENVYADFEYVTPSLEQLEFPFMVTGVRLFGTKDLGFTLVLTTDQIDELFEETIELKFFVPCYNSQNGYYSSNLSLIIKAAGFEDKEISISEYVKDEIW